MGGWALYSAVSGIGTLVAFCFVGVALFGSTSLVAYGGVFQRASLIIGLSWLTLLAGWIWRGGV